LKHFLFKKNISQNGIITCIIIRDSYLHHYIISVDSSKCYKQIFILTEQYYQQTDICLLSSEVLASRTVSTVQQSIA